MCSRVVVIFSIRLLPPETGLYGRGHRLPRHRACFDTLWDLPDSECLYKKRQETGGTSAFSPVLPLSNKLLRTTMVSDATTSSEYTKLLRPAPATDGSQDDTAARLSLIRGHLSGHERGTKLKDKICVITGAGSFQGIGFVSPISSIRQSNDQPLMVPPTDVRRRYCSLVKVHVICTWPTSITRIYRASRRRSGTCIQMYRYLHSCSKSIGVLFSHRRFDAPPGNYCTAGRGGRSCYFSAL